MLLGITCACGLQLSRFIGDGDPAPTNAERIRQAEDKALTEAIEAWNRRPG